MAKMPKQKPHNCEACAGPLGPVQRLGVPRRFCDSCRAIRRRGSDAKRGWRRPSPEKTLQRKRRWYATHQTEARADSLTRYYENAPARRAANSAWKRDNAERVSAAYARWAKNNRDSLNLRNTQRRTLLRDSPGVSKREWAEVFELFGGQCAYCLSPATEIEHIQAISAGGLHEVENVVPACRSCNASKGRRTLLQWVLARRAA